MGGEEKMTVLSLTCSVFLDFNYGLNERLKVDVGSCVMNRCSVLQPFQRELFKQIFAFMMDVFAFLRDFYKNLVSKI